MQLRDLDAELEWLALFNTLDERIWLFWLWLKTHLTISFDCVTQGYLAFKEVKQVFLNRLGDGLRHDNVFLAQLVPHLVIFGRFCCISHSFVEVLD